MKKKNDTRNKVKIYKREEIEGQKGVCGLKHNQWCYGLIDTGHGVYLCEIHGGGMWGYASGDISDKKIFDKIIKQEKDFYCNKTWEQYRSKVMKDIFRAEKYNCMEIGK